MRSSALPSRQYCGAWTDVAPLSRVRTMDDLYG
jgi:hypothetical protein